VTLGGGRQAINTVDPTAPSRRPRLAGVPESELTEEVRATWDGLAPAWERHRSQVFEGFRPVSEWLVEQVAPLPGQTILELAAGSGDTGFLAAQQLGETGRLISTDIAPGMVDSARRGADERGLGNVDCRVMDAQRLDLDDASVDGVICRLGFMLMPDPAAAFREVRRVLRDGGRLAYAVTGSPPANQWMGLMMMALVQRGHSPVGDPFGPGGPFSLSDHDRNRALLEEAGFKEVAVTELAGAMPFESPRAYWDMQSQVGGPIPRIVAGLPVDEVAEIRATVEAMVAQHATTDGYAVPSSLVAVAAH
jgi:ubiquinone/menaquinone biosynthesis C-methylase UbiE